MNKFATLPQSKPSNARVYQLSPVKLDGYDFYGWKMVFFKQVPSGNKTKDNRIKYKSVVDSSKPVIYDQTTQQLQSQQSNNAALAKLISDSVKSQLNQKSSSATLAKIIASNAKQQISNKQTIASLAKQVLELQVKLASKGDN